MPQCWASPSQQAQSAAAPRLSQVPSLWSRAAASCHNMSCIQPGPVPDMCSSDLTASAAMA